MTAWQIHGDWGTTRMRLWLVEDGVVRERCEGPGIGQLTVSPAEALRHAIAPWRRETPPARIVLCGMAGARSGLREAPYVSCPADEAAWRRSALAADLDGIPVVIGAGLASEDEFARPDVMRGEEAQVFGAIALNPELGTGTHFMVLPGTHSKWVMVEHGRVVWFRTFLTGELFDLLSRSSLLAAGGEPSARDFEPGFEAGLARSSAGPALIGQLFEARAAQLREGRSGAWASGFLSGLLIGNEIAEMRGSAPLPRKMTVVGGAGLGERYVRALARFDSHAITMAGDACALAGLELLDADD
ncbi:2-dehydro-3-deoxygalactonokinase [Novosphingobium sp. PS1R-30]|uniref:2-dehydro-3-deoxygalactonokinase n=1 Tax=Novosphingobium anseongense TaxID=3133436 RepID=A0ABU8S1Z2_9SPHN